jgi:hypothetical protein
MTIPIPTVINSICLIPHLNFPNLGIAEELHCLRRPTYLYCKSIRSPLKVTCFAYQMPLTTKHQRLMHIHDSAHKIVLYHRTTLT